MAGPRRWMTWPIRFYQRWISRFTPAMCRFHPTCSEYAAQASERRGLWRGGLLALWRILRCQPFSRGGWDPVPQTGWRISERCAPEERSDGEEHER